MQKSISRAASGALYIPSGMTGESLTSKFKTTIMATAKKSAAAAKKAAPAKAVKTVTAEKGPGKIAQIIVLHLKGKSNAEIVALGFNKTTVSIQVSKYKKEHPVKK